MTTELILGNIGTVSVPAVVVKGHKSISATFESTLTECCKTSSSSGVKSESILVEKGTCGVAIWV